MPEHFDSFFDSCCPIPTTLAPSALHCLLNQFSMPSFELTFKAPEYSVYYFSFLSFSQNSSLMVLSLLCYLSWLLLLITCSDFVFSCNYDFTHATCSIRQKPVPSLGHLMKFYTYIQAYHWCTFFRSQYCPGQFPRLELISHSFIFSHTCICC